MVSALWNAASNGELEDLRTLLRDHPDIEVKDQSGSTALIQAVRNGHVEIVKELLRHGADPNNSSDQGSADTYTQDEGILKLLADARASRSNQTSTETSPGPHTPADVPNGLAAYPYENNFGGGYPQPPLEQVAPGYFVTEGGMYIIPPPLMPADFNLTSPVNGHHGGSHEGQKSVICRYFPNCRYGTSCNYVHPQPVPQPLFYAAGPASQQPQHAPQFDPNGPLPGPFPAPAYYSGYPPPPQQLISPPPSLPDTPQATSPDQGQPPHVNGAPFPLPPPPPGYVFAHPYPPPTQNGAPPQAPTAFIAASYPGAPHLAYPGYPAYPVPPPQQQQQPQPSSPTHHRNSISNHDGPPPTLSLAMPVYSYPVYGTASAVTPRSPERAFRVNGASRDGGNHKPSREPSADRSERQNGDSRYPRRGGARLSFSRGKGVPPCVFYPMGRCRNGDECRFQHVIPEDPSGRPIPLGLRPYRDRGWSTSAGDPPKGRDFEVRYPHQHNGSQTDKDSIAQALAALPSNMKTLNLNGHRDRRAAVPQALLNGVGGKPAPVQRVPNADDFPSLNGSTAPVVPRSYSNASVNGANARTAAEILKSNPPTPSKPKYAAAATAGVNAVADSADGAEKSLGNGPSSVDNEPPTGTVSKPLPNGSVINGHHEPSAIVA